MIASLLIDALFVVAIVAFGWAGRQLGAAPSIVRLASSIVAFGVAALLRDPLGRLIKAIVGGSVDLSRIIAMLLVGIGIYVAMASIVNYLFARRAERRAADPDLELVADPFTDPRVGIVPGAVLGLMWALLFVSMLVLLPAATFLSRGAIDSRVGGLLIRQQSVLEWFSDGFPHYTQTLPKNDDGAVLVDPGDAPVAMGVRVFDDLDAGAAQREAADELRRGIDALRSKDGKPDLNWNLAVAEAVERHARLAFEDDRLSARSSTGRRLETRIIESLGEESGAYEEEIGVRIIWAHSPANALQAIVEDKRSRALMIEERWTEYGIGVVSGGWFNGDVYVIGLIARIRAEQQDADGEEGDDSTSSDDPFGAGADDGFGAEDDASVPEVEGDVDGDGVPDSVAADPTGGADTQTDTDGDGIPDIGDVDPLTPDGCDPNAGGDTSGCSLTP